MISSFNKKFVEGPWLQGPCLILRFPTHEEVPRIQSWFEDPSTIRFMNAEDPFLTYPELQGKRFEAIRARLEHAKKINKIRDAHHSPIDQKWARYVESLHPVGFAFAITQRKDQRLVGALALQISIVHLVGTIRTVIAPESRGKHIGNEAKQLVLEYAFNDLGLEKVCSHMLENNRANRKLNEALGLRVEGVLRDHALVEGARHNVVCMSILRREYDEAKEK
jgi:RimJ/RimL family protein N-acetyltransferase